MAEHPMDPIPVIYPRRAIDIARLFCPSGRRRAVNIFFILSLLRGFFELSRHSLSNYIDILWKILLNL